MHVSLSLPSVYGFNAKPEHAKFLQHEIGYVDIPVPKTLIQSIEHFFVALLSRVPSGAQEPAEELDVDSAASTATLSSDDEDVALTCASDLTPDASVTLGATEPEAMHIEATAAEERQNVCRLLE